MLKYILKRMVYIVIVALILSFLLYTIYNCINVDYAQLRLAGQQIQLQKEGRYEEVYQNLRREMALDEPLFMRYLYWMGLAPWQGEFDGLLQGNFGYSYVYRTDAINLLGEPLKNTVHTFSNNCPGCVYGIIVFSNVAGSGLFIISSTILFSSSIPFNIAFS